MSRPEPIRPVNMRDIARELGVAQSTVSRALRNNPHISADVREKVLATSKKMGYKPNPFISAFTAQVRSYRRSPSNATISLLHSFPKGTDPFLDPYVKGAQARLEEFGFAMEETDLEEFGGSLRVLARALWTRSVSGLLLLPVPVGFDFDAMDFSRLAVATVDPSLHKPNPHRAMPDYFGGMRLALTELAARGYRRIAFGTSQNELERIAGQWFGGYHFWHALAGRKAIPPFILQNWERSEFEKWFARHRPDAIVSNIPRYHSWLLEMGISLPEEAGYAALGLPGSAEVAGVDQRPHDVGAAAADLIIGQINRNEYGLPDVRKSVSVRCKWNDGATVRQDPSKKTNSRRPPNS